jgi:hypothetical protein
MATMIRTAESTGNVPSGRNKRDVAEILHYLNPEAAPLTAFITQGIRRKQVARAPKFEWQEKGDLPKASTATAESLAADTTINVADPQHFKVYDVVRAAPTGEVLYVTAVDTGASVITVTRSVGDTAAATIASGDDLIIIGSAKPEGANVGTPHSYVETTPYNFIQIHERVCGETSTQANTDTYINGSSRERLRREKAYEIRVDIERAFLFGERSENLTDPNNPIRTSGGFLFFATENNESAPTIDEPTLEGWLEGVFAYTGGSGTRMLLASPSVITAIDQMAMGRLQTVSDRNATYGIGVKTFVTGHGDLVIAKHHLLTGPYDGYAIAVDTDKVAYVNQQNLDLNLFRNVQPNGADRWEDAYRAHVGLGLMNPQLHGVLTP